MQGLHYSPSTEVLLEESILGWKEYELELMRDKHDNVVVVCSIENVDPVGVHTGDSVTVAPALTLTDREYQKLRDVGIAVIREVGVDTGGCNIQFAVEPDTGRVIVIEMNPRVSRSSALASKATGFPIAKIAARLAIGYTLDEIPNDITGSTPASFEPTLDYVVVKVPRFAFEKFPAADPVLTTTMKSVGEAMALGRNFTEALGKAMRSIDKKGQVFHWEGEPPTGEELDALLAQCAIPTEQRLVQVQQALRAAINDPGVLERVFEATGHRPVVPRPDSAHERDRARGRRAHLELDEALLRRAKSHGFSDVQIGQAACTSTRPTYRVGAGGGGRLARLQDGRHVCRRVRGRTRRITTARTTRRTRCEPREREAVIILGLRAQPHRPGHRVRLLVRARGADPQGTVRDRHGQLQPRDRVDRLRHLRPPVLRAADVRGRHGRIRG